MVQNERRKAIDLKYKIRQGKENNINININKNNSTDILESINKQLWGDYDDTDTN